ncbi:MAG: GGDEF domain-containing protein [Solobacterium sp.]|nr:GGDEF domain-containing protein [Solobacterium sp.]
MKTENSAELKKIQEFIHQISNKSVSEEKPLREAISSIADSLGLGILTGELRVESSEVNPAGYYEKKVFYYCEEGFSTDNVCTVTYVVDEPGTVTMTACSRIGRTFASEAQIRTLLELVMMASESSFLARKAELSSIRQVPTGLPNTSGYLQEVEKKYADQSITDYDAYYFNLMGFGLITREYGQKESDEILRRYVHLIASELSEGELLGHLGEDNFVALIRKGKHSEAFQHLLEGVDVSLMYGEEEPIRIYCAAGMMPVMKSTPLEQIISGPSDACAEAKRSGKALVILDDVLSERIDRKKQIEQKFERTLQNHEYKVFYQPKVNAVTGELVGAEGLARWYENGVIVPPSRYVPILEESSRITDLDLEVIDMVCADIAEWERNGTTIYPVSVNVSRQDLQDPELFEKISRMMNRYAIMKDHIVIEITETGNRLENSLMVEFLGRLRKAGIKASVDDFGTGFSSLSILREFDVNEIKLDRSFINKELNEKDAVIIRSIIEMAKKLNISVIQEGVETEAQREFVMNLGCERIQGYLYSEPLPKERYEEWIRNGRKPED